MCHGVCPGLELGNIEEDSQYDSKSEFVPGSAIREPRPVGALRKLATGGREGAGSLFPNAIREVENFTSPKKTPDCLRKPVRIDFDVQPQFLCSGTHSSVSRRFPALSGVSRFETPAASHVAERQVIELDIRGTRYRGRTVVRQGHECHAPARLALCRSLSRNSRATQPGRT